MSKNTKIQFCFPEKSFNNPGEFVSEIIIEINDNPQIGYAGYLRKRHLKESLLWRYEDSNLQAYTNISEESYLKINKTIVATLEKCNGLLSIPNPPVHVFVFPWIGPFEEEDRKMGYVSGFATEKKALHVFISPELFITETLQQTIVHEYNHLVFFYHHPTLHPEQPSSTPTILDVLVWEGLAENFAEQITRSKSPASQALIKKQASKTFLTKLTMLLNTKVTEKNKIYENVFFGGNGFERWTGYSVGYWIVKSFLKNNPGLSWEEIMKKEPVFVLENSDFVKGR